MVEKQRCVKIDIIMKNMLIKALQDLDEEKKREGQSQKEVRAFLGKISSYEEKKLFLTEEEHQLAIQALNGLRNSFLAAGRYSDGIDKIFLQILNAKYKRCKSKEM